MNFPMAATQHIIRLAVEFLAAYCLVVLAVARRLKVCAEQQTTEVTDGYLYLANVKAHLADHQPMTEGDEDAWHLADDAQYEIAEAENA